MKKIANYKVLYQAEIEALEEMVNAGIKVGFQPLGGVAVAAAVLDCANNYSGDVPLLLYSSSC